jgi:hypothetical protein
MLQPGGLFGRNPDGVMRQLYRELCRFAHGHPCHTNADIWGSNGPVFVPEAFTQFWRDYRDTFLACAILLKIAYPRWNSQMTCRKSPGTREHPGTASQQLQLPRTFREKTTLQALAEPGQATIER